MVSANMKTLGSESRGRIPKSRSHINGKFDGSSMGKSQSHNSIEYLRGTISILILAMLYSNEFTAKITQGANSKTMVGKFGKKLH